MPYFITIYIHPMQGNIPHAFLGLTRKHPDKLDSDGLIAIDKYSNPQYDLLIGYYFNSIKKDKGKWYEQVYPSILSDDFQGEGFFGFAPVESDVSHWGKVFENNQYAPKGNKIVSEFVEPYYYDRRSPSTFNKSNRCVFEVSQEQYDKLLESIKSDVNFTKDRNTNMKKSNFQLSTSLENIQNTLYYNFNPNPFSFAPLHNCTTWVLHKLDSIGIEVFNIKEWIPDIPIFDDLKELFPYLKFCNTIFLKFQAIDSNLESIKGAKAFRAWARTMIDNIYFYALKCDDGKNECRVESKKIAMDAPAEIILWKTKAYKLFQVYRRLNELNLIKTLMQYQTTGKFLFIYNDKSKDDKKFILDPSNNYEPQHIDELDLSILANNFSANEFYPFIFIPDDNYISNALYHQYHYAIMSENYIKDTMTFYFEFLEGKEIKDYWSESYHVINKRVQNECEFA